MDRGRRTFLGGAVAAALAGAQFPQQRPTRPNSPGDLGPPEDELPKIDRKLLLKRNQQQIQQDVQRLFSLAEQLKNEVGKTDAANILSLPVVQKAEEIEKLAKQIKNLARG